MKKLFLPTSLVIACITLLFSSCTETTSILSNVSGNAYEVLLVIDQDDYNTKAGKEMFDILDSNVPALPQAEPEFNISRITHKQFSPLLKTSRNIVFLLIDSTRYTRPRIKLSRNNWANTQVVITITAPSSEILQPVLATRKSRIINYIRKAENERLSAYYAKKHSVKASNKTFEKFGAQIAVPTSMNKFREADNFLWMSNSSQVSREDIVIYSYPYTSRNQLSKESILHMRDSILGANIKGKFEGSRMGTEYRYVPPICDTLKIKDNFCVEIRGLWRIVDGEAMGGPFISHTQIDEINNRVLTVEGYVFAPSRKKRNLMHQIEAMVYSLKLPQNINEISITAPKK